MWGIWFFSAEWAESTGNLETSLRVEEGGGGRGGAKLFFKRLDYFVGDEGGLGSGQAGKGPPGPCDHET